MVREGLDLKTQYHTASRLDGFIVTEDDFLEWLSVRQIGSGFAELRYQFPAGRQA